MENLPSTMSRHKPQSSKSVRRKYSQPIPIDLLIEIFSRVPAKSIARFRCLSKFWSSIFRRHDFTELFFTKSSTCPRLFFKLAVYSDQIRNKYPSLDEKLLFYSSPQPQNLDGTNSSVVATRYDRPNQYDILNTYTQLCGLVLCQGERKIKVREICNPVMGESIALPSLKGKLTHIFFGYDPIVKQFKVLCITSPRSESPSCHHILTLKTGKRKWRRIECRPHNPPFRTTSVCINGVLYYSTKIGDTFMIVCFDVRSEKFGFINIDVNMLPGTQWYLVNYKGKLGAQKYRLHRKFDLHGNNSKEYVLWVLEDAENHKWSKHVYVKPPLLNKLAKGMKIIGMTSTGEIVFTPFCLSKPFYVYFYNLESETFTRANIQFQGYEEFKNGGTVDTFLDYTENIQGLR